MTTDAPPTTLAAFLLERYDDDEATARAVTNNGRLSAVGGLTAEAMGDVYSFARVLADIEAKRRIVELHAGNGATCSTCGDGHDDYGALHQPFPCDTLKALALPYASHPNFRPEWTA